MPSSLTFRRMSAPTSYLLHSRTTSLLVVCFFESHFARLYRSCSQTNSDRSSYPGCERVLAYCDISFHLDCKGNLMLLKTTANKQIQTLDLIQVNSDTGHNSNLHQRPNADGNKLIGLLSSSCNTLVADINKILYRYYILDLNIVLQPFVFGVTEGFIMMNICLHF